MFVRVHWIKDFSARRKWFSTFRLPITQYFILVGPIAIHIAWGISAKLIKEM